MGFAWFIEKSEPAREAVGSSGLLVLIIAVLVGGLALLGFAMYASFKQRAASLQSRYLEPLNYFELKQKRDAKVETLIA